MNEMTERNVWNKIIVLSYVYQPKGLNDDDDEEVQSRWKSEEKMSY